MALGENTAVNYGRVNVYGYEDATGGYRRGVEMYVAGHADGEHVSGYLVMNPGWARTLGLALIEHAAKADAINETAAVDA